MNTLHEELARQRQREQRDDAASRRVAHRVSSARRWQRAEAWVARHRAQAESASREATDAAQ